MRRNVLGLFHSASTRNLQVERNIGAELRTFCCFKQLISKEACPVTNGLNIGYAKAGFGARGDEIGHLHHLEEGFQHPDFFRGLRVGKSGLEIWVL